MKKITQYALKYIEKNISFYPIDNNSKLPAIIDIGFKKIKRLKWGEYQKRKPHKEEALKWFEKFNEKGIAIVTGSISSLAVVDCDDKESIEKYMEISKTKGHNPYDGIFVNTKRGVHFYYRSKEKIKSLKTLEENFKIELKAENLSVKAPPSYFTDKSGQYKFSGKKIFDLPEWILELSKKKEKCEQKNERNTVSCYDMHDSIQYWLSRALERNDTRNNNCFWMCCQIRDSGAPISLALNAIQCYVELCDQSNHNFSYNEAEACLYSSYSKVSRSPARKYFVSI